MKSWSFSAKKNPPKMKPKNPPALAELLVISATAHAAFSRQALVVANSDLTGEEFPSTPVMDLPRPMTYLFMTYAYMIYSWSVHDLQEVVVIFADLFLAWFFFQFAFSKCPPTRQLGLQPLKSRRSKRRGPKEFLNCPGVEWPCQHVAMS